MSDEPTEPRKVYWRGSQWCVTDYGLETIEPDAYYVEAARLGELTQGDDEPIAERVRHIARKTWVDVEDLIAAFAVATHIHARQFEPMPPGTLFNTIGSVRASRWADGQGERLAEPRRDSIGSISMADAAPIILEIDELLARRLSGGPPFQELPDGPANQDHDIELDDDDDD